MEAKQNFTKDSIEVTATREEWLEIIDQLDDGVWALNDSSEKLVNWLINQKVYG